MSTIITSADGKRRCDGTCHSAKHAKCACICGGKFHGAAVLPEKSAERTELEKLILDKDAHRVVADALLADSPDQPLLFGAPDAL